MPRIAQNLVKHELTGLQVEIVKSTDSNKVGIQGIVSGESRNLLFIETPHGEKKIPKTECTFRFTLETEKVDISGEKLVGRPEDRIKK